VTKTIIDGGKTYRVAFRDDGAPYSVKVRVHLANGGETWRELLGTAKGLTIDRIASFARNLGEAVL
jgi:hypothetical protein